MNQANEKTAMKRFSQSVLFLLTVMSVGFAESANADLVVEFSVDRGSTFGDLFEVQEGSLTTVGVFLSQTDATSTLSDDGLLGFGLAGALSSTDVGVITDGAIDSGFDFKPTEVFTDGTLEWEGLVLNNSVPTDSRILLGEFTFRSVGVGTSSFQFADLEPGSGTPNANWLSGAGAELDEAIFGPGATNTFQLTLNSTAVPEPGSAAVLLMASLPFALRRRRS